MREKQLRTVVTFHTTAEAMALEQICKNRGIGGKLISAPRQLSADCGIAWCRRRRLSVPLSKNPHWKLTGSMRSCCTCKEESPC